MDAEPDDGITSSLKETMENNEPDGEQNSPMQQSPDQSNYNENYRSPESINTVATDEVETHSSEVVQSGECKQHDIEPMESQDAEQSDDKMEVSKGGNSDLENEVDNEIDEKGKESGEQDRLPDNSVGLDNDSSIDGKEVSSISQSDTHIIDSNTITETKTESEFNNEDSQSSFNAVSSTSKGENIENLRHEQESVDNSLDDVSDEDSNDFNPNNTLDDVSDENSNDFNDDSNVSQSDNCSPSHDNSRNDEESAKSTSENKCDKARSNLYFESSGTSSVQYSDNQRTNVEKVCSESTDASFSNLNLSVIGSVDSQSDSQILETETSISHSDITLDSVSKNGKDSVEESSAVQGDAQTWQEKEQVMEV